MSDTISVHDALCQKEWNIRELHLILKQDSSTVNDIEQRGAPLHRVLIDPRCTVPIVQLLLHYGADPNMKFRGQTPLYLALYCRDRVEIVRALVDGGAKAEHPNDCPLSTAFTLGVEREIIELLLSAGSDLFRGDSSGESPLFCALKYFDVATFRYALDLQPDVDINIARNQWGGTLLHNALCISECTAVFVEFLIDMGISVEAVDVFGFTPLHVAMCKPICQPDVVDMLLRKGCLVNTESKDKDTPLYLAIYNHCDFEIVQMLLKYCLVEEPDFDLPDCIRERDHQGRISSYINDCKNELRRMKSENAGNGRTLFEFLKTFSKNQMSRNGEKGFSLDRLLQTISNKQYPLYSNVISSKFEGSLLRDKLKECGIRTVIDDRHGANCEIREVLLNDDCVSVLANCLNEIDLLSLIIAFNK